MRNNSISDGEDMSIELFPHNQTAYESVLQFLERYGRAAVVHPTGTGKSMIAFKLAEEHPNSRICWLAPSEYIFRTQIENLGEDFSPENITFLTYAGLMKAEEEKIFELKPDYIILDEFHRCGAAEWGKGVKGLLSVYPKARVLGLSATSVRYLDNHRDMAWELFDGHVASEMTLGEAIVKGILPTPVYIQSFYAYQEEFKKWETQVSAIKNKNRKNAGEKILYQLRRAMEQADGLDLVFARHMKNPIGKYLVFCSGREHMEEMKQHVGEWFGSIDEHPHVYTVYYNGSKAGREFSAFKEDNSRHLKLLFCIDILNEGVHVADIDGVILLRPTVSPTLYLQQIGRSLSAKTTACPVIFDIVNNFENLCSIDFLKQEIQSALPRCEKTEEKETLPFRFYVMDEMKDCRKLFLQLRENLSADFDVYYRAAADYSRQYGNLNVPQSYLTENGLSLGSWIQTQRRVYAGKIAGILTEEQKKRLDAIGMVWELPSESNWEKGFQALAEYYGKYGDSDVKACYVTEDGFRLGRWVCNLRQKAKKEEPKNFLTEEKLKKLEDVEMIWDKNAYQWEKNYRAAEEYRQTHGNLSVPAGYCTPDGIRLGNWIQNQKQAYAGKRGIAGLSREQVQKLSAIGMEFESMENSFEKNYALAEKYYFSNGNLDIPFSYCEEGIHLGKWIAALRAERKQKEFSPSELTPERIKRLDAIGMVWEKDSWEKRYKIALNYYKEHGNLAVSQNYVSREGVWIGKWLSEQRKRYRRLGSESSLSREQVGKLNAIGMDWRTPREAAWENACRKAEEYYMKYGNLDVPRGYTAEDGFRLDLWIARQKKECRNRTVTAGRRERLQALGILKERQAMKTFGGEM